MLEVAVTNERCQTHLGFNRRQVKRFTALAPRLIAISTHSFFNRRRVECFIEEMFHRSYGATIHKHYPTLMSVHDEEDNILAALGFRCAKEEPLFLEQYLDVPVEQLLRNHTHQLVRRESIAEVGNLASQDQGASIFLFAALNAYFVQQGIEFDAFTATDFLYRYFTKLGMNSVELGKANQERLLDRGASWGTYYKENPRIIAGSVHQVLFGLYRHLQVVWESSDVEMMVQLHSKTFLKPQSVMTKYPNFLRTLSQGKA